ncbi:hypothetical protein [Haloglycomyces albus]|nr:hypothetical protein [Haloglycomyces albus]
MQSPTDKPPRSPHQRGFAQGTAITLLLLLFTLLASGTMDGMLPWTT